MGQHFGDILQQRTSRRRLLKAFGLGIAATSSAFTMCTFKAKAQSSTSALSFQPIGRFLDEQHHLAQGYDAQIVMRWGDALFADSPEFKPYHQTACAQEKQFGFNNDYIAYFPINGSSRHGLLCINHEYTSAETMFPGGRFADAITNEEHHIEMAAHGCSIIEMEFSDKSGWQPVLASVYNRRITASTPMRIQGPAAGTSRMQTSNDPSGKQVLGMFGNCAGGQTPWASYLTCEENIDGYFIMEHYDGAERANHDAMTMGKDRYHRWDKIDPRFNIDQEPHEPNRFGWVVEIDPFDAQSTPIKHTALGRFKHESATPVINPDGRVVVYSGDDAHFEHLYKFVSNKPYNASASKAENSALLDDGVLYAARFEANGTVTWLPLIYGTAPLNADNGFHSQADVLIETRRAAKLLGATPMDRPEDVEVHAPTGRVYASLTKNPKRTQADAVNRRAPNPYGYVLELLVPETRLGYDHAATTSRWDIVHEGRKETLACPDNLAIDPQGHLWVTTDGQPSAIDCADTVYAMETLGPRRGQPKALFCAPIGAEITGPCFTPDGETFFLSVQHPGERSSFEKPTTRWPDFDPAMPPRSAIIAIRKTGGGRVGS